MNLADFTIVLTKNFSSDVQGNKKMGVPEFYNYVQSEEYEARGIIEIINCNIKFEYVLAQGTYEQLLERSSICRRITRVI